MSTAQTKLIALIKQQLGMVSKSSYPFLFEQMQSKQGMEKVVQMVYDFAVKNQISVSAAIVQLENEFNI